MGQNICCSAYHCNYSLSGGHIDIRFNFQGNEVNRIDVFSNPLNLINEKGSIGITPHRNGFRYKNLICNFNIDGRGRFFICTDRSGKDSCEITFLPANVLFMRAPGFLGSDERPFHYVADIKEARYVFGLRQKALSTVND